MIGSFRLPLSLTSGDTTLPTITTATVEDANPDKLVVVFSEVVTITNTTGLTITGAATPTLSAPIGSGTDTITFTLSTALTNGQSVTLNVASSNTIKDAANNSLAATTRAITNNVAAPVISYEAETTSYMNAVAIPDDTTVYYATTPQEITGAAIWTAVDDYVKEVRAFYYKFKAIYLFLGDTALQMKWNLKNPLDTDAAFRLAFFGSGTLSATGWKGNGTNAYLETFLNQSTVLALNNESVGYYIRTPDDASGYTAGVLGAGNTGTTFIIRTNEAKFRNQTPTERTVSLSNYTGLIATSRLISTEYRIQSRNTGITDNISSNSLVNFTFKIGSLKDSAYFSGAEFAFSYISDGLTYTELLAHNTAVENLQTALKRNVV